MDAGPSGLIKTWSSSGKESVDSSDIDTLFRDYEARYFGLERLTTEEIVSETKCRKPCHYREYRKVGEPTRIFQFEDENKGLKLWVVSRELATEVKILSKCTELEF